MVPEQTPWASLSIEWIVWNLSKNLTNAWIGIPIIVNPLLLSHIQISTFRVHVEKIFSDKNLEIHHTIVQTSSIKQLIILHHLSLTLCWAFALPQHVWNGVCRHVHILFQTCNSDTREDAKTYMTFFSLSPHEFCFLLPDPCEDVCPSPSVLFCLWRPVSRSLDVMTETAWISFGTLSVRLPLETLSYCPLNASSFSFLTLGDWSSFHNIAPDPEVLSSHNLINMKFYRCLQFVIVRLLGSGRFLIVQWHHSLKSLTCTILPGSYLRACHSQIMKHDRIWRRILEHRHSLNLQRTELRVLVLLPS